MINKNSLEGTFLFSFTDQLQDLIDEWKKQEVTHIKKNANNLPSGNNFILNLTTIVTSILRKQKVNYSHD